MIYKELGKTGMKISHLCFGASSLGSVFHATKEAESIELSAEADQNGTSADETSAPDAIQTLEDSALDGSSSAGYSFPQDSSGNRKRWREYVGLLRQTCY